MATKWGPDTCGCVIERIPDGGPNGDTATWVSTETTCPEHAGLSGQDLLDTCLRENRRRTHVRWLAEINYGLTELQTRPFSRDPNDANVTHFDANRKLVVIFKDRAGSNLLSNQEKTELQDAVDIQSGFGQVEIG